jgi:hypothetical protein
MSEYDQEEEGELDERDWPDEADDSDSVDLVPCPYCGEEIYEKAELCPHCRNFVSFEDARPRQPRWIWIAVICGLLCVVTWVLCG